MILSIKKRRGYAAEFTGQHGHFFPIVKIESKDAQLLARFVVDTGATLCSIPAEAAKHLNLQPIRVDRGISTAVQYAELPVVILERVELLNTKLSVAPLEAWVSRDFLLGMNFLSLFKVRFEHGRKLVIET